VGRTAHATVAGRQSEVVVDGGGANSCAFRWRQERKEQKLMVYCLVHGKTPATLATFLSDHLVNIDGDFSEVEITDLTPDGGAQISNVELNSGRPVKPDHMPTRLKRKKAFDQPLADYMPAPKGAAFVSQRFKDLVEEFEPGVHQFFEMSVKSGKEDLGVMHYFIVCNRIDGLDHAACVPPIRPQDHVYRGTFAASDRQVFSAKKIGGKHLWVEKHWMYFWMSDVFRDAVFAAGLTGIKDTCQYDEIEQNGVIGPSIVGF
jgi:uncharacterized protein DUF1629